MKKEILLKRNELKNSSLRLQSIKFGDDIESKAITKVMIEQNNVYNKWKFYDGIIKAMHKKN